MDIKNGPKDIKRIAQGIRKRVLGLTIEKNGCYLSQALSSAEIFAVLYGKILKLNESIGDFVPEALAALPGEEGYKPGSLYNGKSTPDSDRILVSASHYAAGVYATLVETGRLSEKALEQFNTDGSIVEMIGAEHSPGFELTTGSFGQCISQGAGIATSRKKRGESGRVFIFVSDGEIQEGQNWEGIQASSFYKLDNMVIFVDVNGQQVDGYTKDVMNVEPLDERFKAFGAKVIKVDGHDIEAIETAVKQGETGKPLAILCYTNSTQGMPFLEKRKPKLHYVRLKEDEKQEAIEFYNQM